MLGWTATVGAQEVGAPVGAGAQVRFGFDRPGMEVPHYVIAVNADGSGTYEATAMAATEGGRYGLTGGGGERDRGGAAGDSAERGDDEAGL